MFFDLFNGLMNACFKNGAMFNNLILLFCRIITFRITTPYNENRNKKKETKSVKNNSFLCYLRFFQILFWLEFNVAAVKLFCIKIWHKMSMSKKFDTKRKKKAAWIKNALHIMLVSEAYNEVWHHSIVDCWNLNITERNFYTFK